MNKISFIISIILFSILLHSCEKITPEEKKEEVKTTIQKNQNFTLEEMNYSKEISFPEEPNIKERFALLSQNFNKYDDLIKSKSYQDFVIYIHELFDKYKAEGGKDIELDYLFTKIIPGIVVDNFLTTGKITDEIEIERIIQSIKRKDFNTIREKDLLTEKFKIYFEENFFNNFIKNIEIKDTLSDEEFKHTFLSQSGVFYQVLKHRYDWNKTGIGYKQAQEPDFVKYINSKIEKIFSLYGYTPETIENKVFEIYGYNSLEDLAKDIEKDFLSIVEKYELNGKMPIDREYRNDEQDDIFENRASFNNYINTISSQKLNNFESDLRNYRIKMYLISYFGRNRLDLDDEQGLWSSQARSKFISSTVGAGVQNLFRLSRYTSEEPIVIDLYNKNNTH